MHKNSVGTYNYSEFFPYIAVNRGLNNRKTESLNKIFGIKNLIRVIFIMIFFSLLFVAFAWTRVQCTTLTYSIVRLGKESKKIEEDNKRLKILKAKLTAPERIERIAMRKLDMSYPTEGQIVIKSTKY